MSLQKAMEVHSELVSRTGMGINSPLVRRLQEVIKTAYGREGHEAIKQARIEASKVAGSSVNALLRRNQTATTEPVKRTGEARLQRLAQQQPGAPQSKQLSRREQRNQLRAVLQESPIQKSTNVSEEGESVAAVKPSRANIEGPLTPDEVAGIGQMSAKEIVETFGANRIDLTLESIGQEATGSDRQRANKLRKLLIAE